jgi:translation elongation factor EF-G
VKCEPYEEAVVEVPETYVGSVVELFAQRKGEMLDMQPSIEVSGQQMICDLLPDVCRHRRPAGVLLATAAAEVAAAAAAAASSLLFLT